MENQRRRISLVTLMGLPGCGKSTLCQELIKFVSTLEHTSESSGIPSVLLLQYDTIVPLQIQSQFSDNPNLAKTLRTNFLKLLTQFVQLLQNVKCDDNNIQLDEIELLEIQADKVFTNYSFVSSFRAHSEPLIPNDQKDLILLIDDNNYYKSMRNDFYQIAKSNGLGFCVLYPDASPTICQKRNSERIQELRVPSDVIVEMSKKLDEPNPLQNAADVLCLRISDVLDSSTHRLIYDTVVYTLQNPIQASDSKKSDEATRSRRICAINEIHQADLILRKWIHTELALASFGSKRQELKSKGQELQVRKSAVLEGLKSGEMQVTSSPGDEFQFHKDVLALARQVKLGI